MTGVHMNVRAEQPSVEHRVKSSRQGSNWLSLLLIAAFAVLIGTAGYYAFRYVDRSTFNDARAFRVLDELVSQFENFQQTMASLLALVPEEKSNREQYTKTWVLPRLELANVGTDCPQEDKSAVSFVLQGREAEQPFAVSRCVQV